MSNLIKSVYFNVNPSKTRVIDSDERVEEFIPEIYKQEKDEDGLSEEEFTTGLPVISMEEVVNEEREKLSRAIEEEKDEILSTAKQEAEEILNQARAQEEEIFEQARKAGQEQGLAQGKQEALESLEQERQTLQEEYAAKELALQKQEESLEPEFANLIVALVKKLTGVVCEEKKDVILYLIGNAMKNLEKSKQIIIRVSKDDMARVSAKKATFKLLAKDVEDFDVMEDASLATDQCIIETENKMIDCSLDAQLQNLEEHIKLLV